MTGSNLDSSDVAVETGRWIHAIAKHLAAFAASPELASLYAISRSARDGEFLLRIRGLGVISPEKAHALALDAGIPRQEVETTLQRIQDVTQLIAVERSNIDHGLKRVTETIFTEQEVYRAIAKLFDAADPIAAERTLIPLLGLLSQLPMTEEEVITRVCGLGFTEQDVLKALELQVAFKLLQKRQVSSLGITLMYNEYLWGSKIERIDAVLAKMGSQETEGLLALVQEVRSSQGKPVQRLSSAPQHIRQLAVDTGIIDTTTILSKSGDAKTFAFSPHFYGYRAGSASAIIEDTSDQVKLFLASIGYGVHYSEDFRLRSPEAFVQHLLRNGEAGCATPILRDYVLLERQGIVTVEERTRGRGTFVLQKPDVVERALNVMKNGTMRGDSTGGNDPRFLATQRGFRSPERNRISNVAVGNVVGNTDQFQDELMAVIRETAQSGTWG